MSDKIQDEFKTWIQDRQLQIVQNCASEEFFIEEVEIRTTRLIDELSILQCKLEGLEKLLGHVLLAENEALKLRVLELETVARDSLSALIYHSGQTRPIERTEDNIKAIRKTLWEN